MYLRSLYCRPESVVLCIVAVGKTPSGKSHSSQTRNQTCWAYSTYVWNLHSRQCNTPCLAGNAVPPDEPGPNLFSAFDVCFKKNIHISVLGNIHSNVFCDTIQPDWSLRHIIHPKKSIKRRTLYEEHSAIYWSTCETFKFPHVAWAGLVVSCEAGCVLLVYVTLYSQILFVFF